MRLSTGDALAEEDALATIAAAAESGITVFDTARAYGDNEPLLARALRACGSHERARIVTKGGMTSAGGAWVPDGRAKAIRSDCEASLAALAGLPIDLYLLHAPDPRTPWQTSVRALARLVDEGLIRSIGLSNVNRRQLDEALELAPVAAVQVALSPFDDRALRGGVVDRCEDEGIAVIAHSPLGGPGRAGRVGRVEELVRVAEARSATPAEVALAWLLGLSPVVVPIPGARRPETARSAARAAALDLDADAAAVLTRAFGRPLVARPRLRAGAEVVVVMGIPGAGKSHVAEEYVARGYVRLNRDERGGTLRGLMVPLEEELASPEPRVVLDNTYLTRASRTYVLDAAARHGAPVRCVWLDTPLAQAQVNLTARLLDLFGQLPGPAELRELAKREQGVLAPTSQMRAARDLEPPSLDEGFVDVERLEFARARHSGTREAVFVAASAVRENSWSAAGDAPHLVFDWLPGGSVDALGAEVERVAARVTGAVEAAVCPHPGGPPTCWCRPPLPGLILAFARAHDIDWSRSTLVGTSAAHRTLASTLGARFVPA
jgi:aryl-alcohol dehydrogenase-like predicted oxidoreductase/predicted kinase